MKKVISLFSSIILALSILTVSISGIIAVPVSAAENDDSLKKVRVGYYDLRNCMEGAQDGARKYGYVHDVLGEVSAVCKWQVEYVYGDLDELLNMLADGEIDVLPCISYNEERAERMLYSDDSIVDENYNIYAYMGDDEESLPKKPQDIEGALVATVQGAFADNLLDQWEEENGIKTSRIYCDSFEEAWKMVGAGTADYAVNLDYTAPDNQYIPMFPLGSCGSYFTVSMDREDLLSDINNAIDHINHVSPFLFSKLEEEYLNRGADAIQLSDNEKEWLTDHPIIRIGAFSNDYPYSFINSDGEKVGVYRDTTDMIFDSVGLSVEYEWILFDTIQEANEALQKGEIDVFCEYYHDYDIAEQNEVIISNSINEVTMGIMSVESQNSPHSQKIAVAGTRLGKYYAMELYPDSELVECTSVSECIEKVVSGEAGYAIAHTSLLHQFSSGYSQTFSMTPLSFKCAVCYSAARANPEIISIINRGLNLISQEDYNLMELQYTTKEVSGGYTVRNFIREHIWIAIMVGILLLVAAFIAINRAIVSARLKSDIEEIRKLRDEQQKNEELLEVALNQAKAANRAKTTFLNNMSHDIRTPMNAIIGYTGLASSHIDNKEQVQDYLSKIGQSSEHLLSLINDVLDMSRIESGKVSIEENTEDLSEILHTLRNIVQADINNKQLDFFLDTDVQDQYVVCDKLRLNQVLLNVLSNSIKYTQPGGMVSLRIRENGLNDSGYVKYEFRIKDNGMGMSEEFLKTIYEPFTRVKSSTVSGIQGTGLGMAITKNIVDMMGGTIEISSKEKEGTETVLKFEFRLDECKPEPVKIAQLEGLKSLVVDDDISACQNVSKMLRDTGMRSEWCTSGKEAVIRTEEAVRIGEVFKVYIIDWMMPDMNGIESARRIRQVVGEEAPIIVLTAYDWSDIEEEAKAAGVTAFVSKPVFPSDINRVLNKCCGIVVDEESEEEKEYDFTGKKILLVEDNEMNREIAQEILEEEGFIIDVAEDGTIAVEKMKEAVHGQYDLVLMDIQMPIMNGYDATRAIRALPDRENAEITIIAMTANAFDEDRQKAFEAGMNGHLSKPIEVDKLKKTLAECLLH